MTDRIIQWIKAIKNYAENFNKSNTECTRRGKETFSSPTD